MLQAILLVSLCWVGQGSGQDCFLPRNLTNCEECADEGLDLSTGCTTCVSPLSIECEEGEQNCAVGNFVFSALFRSYQNPTHMCAECSDDRGPVTCESVDRGLNCGLRFIYCLQPYGDQNFTPPLIPQARFGEGNDSETFTEDIFIQMNTESSFPNIWNRSNPFTRKLTYWPGRIQFFVAVYNAPRQTFIPRVVDKVLIDLEQNISSSFTERRTYSGVNNFSHFDMSFRVNCEANYYGPQCNKFCIEDETFACDRDGNRQCSNSSYDFKTNCTTAAETEDNDESSTSSSPISFIPALVGGLAGGLVAAAIMISTAVLIVAVCLSRKKGIESIYENDDFAKK